MNKIYHWKRKSKNWWYLICKKVFYFAVGILAIKKFSSFWVIWILICRTIRIYLGLIISHITECTWLIWLLLNKADRVDLLNLYYHAPCLRYTLDKFAGIDVPRNSELQRDYKTHYQNNYIYDLIVYTIIINDNFGANDWLHSSPPDASAVGGGGVGVERGVDAGLVAEDTRRNATT